MASRVRRQSEESFFKTPREFPKRFPNGMPIGPRTERRQKENRELNKLPKKSSGNTQSRKVNGARKAKGGTRSLNRVSKKRRVENSFYLRLRSLYLTEHWHCEYPGCLKLAKDIHHKNGRNGKRLIDQEYFMAICRWHHTFIHNHPKRAREMGLLK